MANLANVEFSVRGPVNGMGEDDLRGSYYRVVMVFPDDEIVRGKMTLAQLQEIRDEVNNVISKANS